MRLNHLLVFLFLLVGNNLLAQYGPQQVILDTKSASSTFAADLDGDGDNDILTNANGISWHRNEDGLGNFSKRMVISGASGGVSEIHAVDVNGDGHLDILAERGSSIAWYENTDGMGNFGTEQLITSGNKFDYADMEGDGDIDIFVLDGYTDQINGFAVKTSWLENEDGNGSFGSKQELTLYFIPGDPTFNGAGINDIAVSDLNGNDYADVAIITKLYDNSMIYWYENLDGLGTFGDRITIDNFYGLNATLQVEDIDNDGDQDIIGSINFLTAGVFCFKNLDGQGNFGDKIQGGGGKISAIQVGGDINGDGAHDVAYAADDDDGFGGQVGWVNFLNDTPSNQVAVWPVFHSYSAVSAADLDGDGDLDLIYFNSTEAKLYWKKNLDGAGSFGGNRAITYSVYGAHTILSGDFDSDGDLDILTAQFVEYLIDDIVWHENINGTVGTSKNIEPNTGAYSPAVARADLDGDGDLDVVTTNLNGSVRWFENEDGQGNFSSSISIPMSSGFWIGDPIYTADLDSDGDQDILVCSISAEKIYWLENEDGQGSFGPSQLVAESLPNLVELVPADLNGDGSIDILKATSTAISWYENIGGTENFSAEQMIIDGLSNVSSISTIDLDDDGDQDILTTIYGSSKVVWYSNENGMGSFGLEQIISDGIFQAASALAVDVDDDGDLDIVATYSNNTSWFENLDGAETFGTAQVIVPETSTMLATGDFNGDLIPDLFCLHNNKITWHENISNATGTLSGTCFWDENENGTQEPSEQTLNDQGLLLQPLDLYTTSSELGTYRYYPDIGTYNLALPANSNWTFTTPNVQTVDIVDYDSELIHNIGLIPITNSQQAGITLISGPTRCGFDVPFWLNVSNNGTEINSGTITLNLDDNPLVSYISASPEPTSISGNLLTWDYADMLPTHEENVFLILQMPGVDNIGEQIQLLATATVEDGIGGIIFTDVYNFQSTINCAYDPNDKLVSPEMEGTANYLFPSDTLMYTIRFQNTGTDTAFNVTITDQLDDHLDLESFRIVSSSHSYEVSMNASGFIEFNFPNILLPDSTTNEILSHGFISFEILPLSGLTAGQVIENGANIFFDFNPPIVTNVVESVFIYILDEDGDGYGLAEDCDDTDPEINPAADEIPNNDIDENCDEYFAQDLDNDGFWDDVDCDDNNDQINPGASEVCDDLDNDCNLQIDDGLPLTAYFLDADNDGFGNPFMPIAICDSIPPVGYVYNFSDCDDTNSSINPSATEIPNNGIDEDCLDGDLMVSTNEIEKLRPQIFPNPTTGKLNIQLPYPTAASLIIKDYNGKTILAESLGTTNSINLAALPSGVYIVLIQTKGEIWTERVVKMRNN